MTEESQAAAKGNLEKYLKGEPQTDELAALQRGEGPETDTQRDAATSPPIAPVGWEVTDDDRENLRRLIFEPGWAVYLKLLDREIRKQEDFAKATSENDPLANRDKIANEWANLAALKRARNLGVVLIEQEVKKLQGRKTDAPVLG